MAIPFRWRSETIASWQPLFTDYEMISFWKSFLVFLGFLLKPSLTHLLIYALGLRPRVHSRDTSGTGRPCGQECGRPPCRLRCLRHAPRVSSLDPRFGPRLHQSGPGLAAGTARTGFRGAPDLLGDPSDHPHCMGPVHAPLQSERTRIC